MSGITGNVLILNMLCELILQFILFLFVTMYGYKISISSKINGYIYLKFSAFIAILLSDMAIIFHDQFTLNTQIYNYGILIFGFLFKLYGYFLIAIIIKKIFSFMLASYSNKAKLT